MLSDDELAEIRRRKMQLLLEKAKQVKIPEPMSKGYPVLLTDAIFWQTIRDTKIALVDFYGEWCQPCKQLAPVFASLAQEYKGRVFFGKIDIDRNPRTAAQFDVQSVPMVIVFKDGKAIGALPGLRPYNDYDMILEDLLP